MSELGAGMRRNKWTTSINILFFYIYRLTMVWIVIIHQMGGIAQSIVAMSVSLAHFLIHFPYFFYNSAFTFTIVHLGNGLIFANFFMMFLYKVIPMGLKT